MAAIAPRALRTPLSQSSRALRLPSSRLANVSTAGFHHSAKWQQNIAQAEAEESIAEDGPVTEFKELAARGLVHPNVVNTITRQMRLTTMTDVQSRTINEALSGVDV